MESTNYADRRKEPRYDICIDVKAMISGNSFGATARNISGGGMEIRSSKSINPGSKLTVSLQIHEKFVFRGKVVWVLGEFVGSRWIYRAGVQTETISLENGMTVKGEDKMKLVKKILPLIKAMGDDPFIANLKAA